MTVFVDDMRLAARVGRLEARWSHLMVGPFDHPDELHEFAARIGLARRWYQGPPGHSWPGCHYDVTDTKRREAIRAGAVQISWRDAGRHMVEARWAWTATRHLVCAADGRPASKADRVAAARALYELAMSKKDETVMEDTSAGDDVTLWGPGQ